MSLILTTREDMENRSLAHYRTPGSKNGQRLYQYEDGSLTPLGRIHYGVGLGRDRTVTGGKKGALIGKKQVNSDGTLTKRGIKNVEEASKNGYMNLSESDKKKGRADNRLDVIKQMNEEAKKDDPDGVKGNNIHSVSKEIFDGYKEKYAEATLKDLGLPVNKKNKETVDKFFSKYDTYYDWDAGTLDTESAYKREKEFGDRWKERFDKGGSTNKEIKEHVEKGIKDFNEKTQEAKKERAEKAAEEKKQRQAEIAEIRSLSDMELNKRIDRLQRERTYADLINERANYEKSPLQAKAAKIFEQFAENFARKALNQAGDEVLRKIMEKGRKGNNSNQQQNNQNKSNDNSKSQDQKKDTSGYGADNRFGKQEKQKIRSMAASGKSVEEIAKSMNTTEERVRGFMASAGIKIDKDKKDS